MKPRIQGPREGTAHLTLYMMKKLVHLCNKERRKAERAAEKNAQVGWQPKPGCRDVNAGIMLMMDDIIGQLAPQIAAAEARRQKGKAHGPQQGG